MQKKILVIEDDLLTCRSYQKLLEKAGYQVDCALDGEEGLAKSSNGYDYIILDIGLPKKDGWQVLNELKSKENTQKIPVVICTVLDGDHYRERAQANGAVGFVNKFHDDFLAEVTKIVQSLKSGEFPGKIQSNDQILPKPVKEGN